MSRRRTDSLLQKAEADLQRLYDDQAELERKIARQKRRVALLTELSSEAEDPPAPVGLVTGITDACKTVIYAADGWLAPAEIRDRITALGLPEQKNLLASVHTILKRLAASRQIREKDGLYSRPLTRGEWTRGIR